MMALHADELILLLCVSLLCSWQSLSEATSRSWVGLLQRKAAWKMTYSSLLWSVSGTFSCCRALQAGAQRSKTTILAMISLI